MSMTRVQDGNSINYLNTSTTSVIESGTPVFVGTVLGVANDEIGIGETGSLTVHEVHDVRKDGTDGTQGVKLYWDDDGTSVDGDTGCLTATATLGVECGRAWSDFAAGDSTVAICLNF